MERRKKSTDKGGLLNLTPRGYYAWVILMREFFVGVNRLRQDCLTARGGLG
jgi:hypothetical protein